MNTYIVDRLMVAYWYRKPPMYDDKIYIEALRILKVAPILTFALGYWALSNSQMFNNTPIQRAFTNQGGNPRHSIIDWDLSHLNQGHMALIIFGLWFLRIIFYDTIVACFKEEAPPKPKKRKSKKAAKEERARLMAKMAAGGGGMADAFKGFGGLAAAKTAEEGEDKPAEPVADDDDDENFEVDENLPFFWIALNGRDQNHWYAQEVYNLR
jgi:hypothetical protein